MARYDTIREETLRVGTNGYVEVARKRLMEGESATEFLILTRGFFDRDGSKRWTRFVTLPLDDDVRAWLLDALRRA